MIVDPCATRQNVPIWIGGRSARSLRRAIELADGWVPFGEIDQLAAMIAKGKESPAWQARQEPLEIFLRPDNPLDPTGKPEQTADQIRRLFTAGATGLTITVSSHSCSHYVEQLEALAALKV